MNIKNEFDFIMAVVFAMNTQLGGILPKEQELVI